MDALLRLEGAAFGYGGRTILSGVDIEVRAGEFLGLVGPNGAGKTTLFRGILGLITPLSGSVQRFAGAVGYVPQRESLDALFPLTVEEVVHMGAYGRLRGLHRLRAEDRELAREVLARVELADRSRALFASLSGGQRQRTLIARALMVRPQLLLLDEPTSGVDRGAEERILALLADLAQRERLAVLLVSHQIAMVRAVAREVLWVADGRVVRTPASELARAERLDRLFAHGSSAQEESP